MLKSEEAEVRKTDLSYRNDEQIVPLLVSHRRSAVSHRLFSTLRWKTIRWKAFAEIKGRFEEKSFG
jgi:hypothetical protein